MADISGVLKYIRADAPALACQRNELYSSIKSHIEMLEHGLRQRERDDYTQLLAECEGEDPGYYSSLRDAHDFVHKSMFIDGEPEVGQLRLMAAYGAVTMVGSFVETSLSGTCEIVRETLGLKLGPSAFTGAVPWRNCVFLQEYARLGPYPEHRWSELRQVYEVRNEIVHQAGRVRLDGSARGELIPKSGSLKKMVDSGRVSIAHPEYFGDPSSETAVLVVDLDFCLEVLRIAEEHNREILVSVGVAPALSVTPEEYERLQIN